jgi:hypothetical protein
VFLAEVSSVGYDAVGRAAPNQLKGIPDLYRAFRADRNPVVVKVPEIAAPSTKITPDDGE